MTEGTDAITTIHFVWMGLLALLVVAGIVAGVRARRRRIQAEREVEAHAAEAGVLADPPPAPGSAPPAQPSAPSVAPSPPPLADQPASGMPAAPEPEPASPIADEPIAAAVAPDGTTATIAADAVAAEPASDADGPVTQLKGLGPKVAARLAEMGIERVGQLAALDDAEAARIDADLGAFAGRMARDRWVEQARLLAAGDREGFERVFGRL